MSGLEELSREELLAHARDQDVQLRDQAARLEEQDVQLRELQVELERLRRQVSRNSGNSSMPPSSDDLPGKTKPPVKPARQAGRERGKQPGAKGSGLSRVADPDHVKDECASLKWPHLEPQ